MWVNLAWVAAGGALGAAARYLVSVAVHTSDDFPAATLVSCVTNTLPFRARKTAEGKARPAANVWTLARVATRPSAVLRAPEGRAAQGLWRCCGPCQYGSILAAGRALPQTLCGTLKGSVFVTQDTGDQHRRFAGHRPGLGGLGAPAVVPGVGKGFPGDRYSGRIHHFFGFFPRDADAVAHGPVRTGRHLRRIESCRLPGGGVARVPAGRGVGRLEQHGIETCWTPVFSDRISRP